MKCLVTGATGFIGKALLKRLIQDGHSVKAIAHKTSPDLHEKNLTYVKGDITDYETIKSIVSDVDIIFHCAAIVKDYGSKKQFFKVNVEGAKNLAKACNKNLKMFIFISHIQYEYKQFSNYYSITKQKAEQYLIKKYKKENFPVAIIRPGNVYGPGATTWVLRPLKAIQKNRITLVDHGNGIFLHTYIDNLIDSLISTMNTPKMIGESINITDGDNSTTWVTYLNDLAKIAGKKKINRNLSIGMAINIGRLSMFLYKIFRITPIVTPSAVSIFTNTEKISIKKAEEIIGYKPKINYNEGMKRVNKWLCDNNYI